MRVLGIVLIGLLALGSAGLLTGCCGGACTPPTPCDSNPCRWWDPCGSRDCAPIGDPCDCCDPRG